MERWVHIRTHPFLTARLKFQRTLTAMETVNPTAETQPSSEPDATTREAQTGASLECNL